jgi:hypothetical protein
VSVSPFLLLIFSHLYDINTTLKLVFSFAFNNTILQNIAAVEDASHFMSHLDETGSAVEITDITDSAQFPTYRQHVVVGEFERTDKLKTDETQKAKTEQTTLTALQESVWVFYI